jgi:saccharopine dehydrogenase-like NADP-dependent oxidoreductase
VARALAADPGIDEVYVVRRDARRLASSVAGWVERVIVREASLSDLPAADVTVVAIGGGVRKVATAALSLGSHVVCALDDPSEVRAALALDSMARPLDLSVVVGATMAPGLSCVLAARLKSQFDRVEEIHVASVGTGGPACARRHHAALTGVAMDWDDGDWRRRPGGSGRELVWFPDPVGGADCYRASLADPLLLVPVFRDARRVTSRLEATRRDRLTSWLPMLRRPHPEGLLGAVRVEARGWVDGRAETRILGAASPPAVAAAAVATVAARWALDRRFSRPGAAGLAELVSEPGAYLSDLSAGGVPVYEFEGGYATNG